MTQWLAHQVWVVTLVGAATPHPGNPWKPCFRTPWDQTQILQPHALNLTSANIAPHHPTYIRISLALLSPRFRLCKCNYCCEIFHSRGRTLTFQVTNAHPGTQSKSFAPKVDQFEESRFLVINNSASNDDGGAFSLCDSQWWCVLLVSTQLPLFLDPIFKRLPHAYQSGILSMWRVIAREIFLTL